MLEDQKLLGASRGFSEIRRAAHMQFTHISFRKRFLNIMIDGYLGISATKHFLSQWSLSLCLSQHPSSGLTGLALSSI